ncbi:ABC transporter permease [Jatrophihabitans sp.]|uniref:ABC transporter permease n=1 Tax=Jatrophihabitans sp. TaxID=1932789 RepID=UPI0030C6C2D0|nr:potI [Jatrophihabitans sp.]
MSAIAGLALEEAYENDHRPVTVHKPKRKGFLLPIWGWLVILWLSSPIVVMIVFGFNDGTGRATSTKWNGFTFKWYQNLFSISDLTTALGNSITIAIFTTLIAVVLGTLMGVALGRWKFRGAGSVNLLLFANIAAPEVVLGAALLSLFLTLNIPRGYVTILLAHVMFSIAYVVVTVRARMSGLDPSLEEAARDLGAGPLVTFFRVTLPLIAPGVSAGALLAFAMSIDDYIITSFNNGSTQTFPLWVYGAAERTGGSVPPQVNVMGTLIFAFGVIVAVGGAVANRKRA